MYSGDQSWEEMGIFFPVKAEVCNVLETFAKPTKGDGLSKVGNSLENL